MEEKTPKSKRKKSKTNWYWTISGSLLLTAVVLVVCILMQGQTKIVIRQSGVEKTISLTCDASGKSYPFFKYDDSRQKTTSVRVVFDDADNLNSISLVYTLKYDDAEQIEGSEDRNHAAMNLKTQNEGLGPDVFNLKFAKLKDALQMSLYAKAEDLNSNTVKYFELDWLNDGNYGMENVKKSYQQKGFKCVANN